MSVDDAKTIVMALAKGRGNNGFTEAETQALLEVQVPNRELVMKRLLSNRDRIRRRVDQATERLLVRISSLPRTQSHRIPTANPAPVCPAASDRGCSDPSNQTTPKT